ncbi:unnamed protein product [Cylicocyclus nassatus]|uniref:Uncharacterized protein n=1 Tax=Cylicocyclus nassatus TaxID=53992 RepID=A0AA36DMX6_CYLNA|nr:unnamed protein product [Cylicocyclus nassatus]
MLYTFFLIFILLHANAAEEETCCFSWFKSCISAQNDEACENAAYNHCLKYCSIYNETVGFDECMAVCLKTYVNTSTPTPGEPKKERNKFLTFFKFVKEFLGL